MAVIVRNSNQQSAIKGDWQDAINILPSILENLNREPKVRIGKDNQSEQGEQEAGIQKKSRVVVGKSALDFNRRTREAFLK